LVSTKDPLVEARHAASHVSKAGVVEWLAQAGPTVGLLRQTWLRRTLLSSARNGQDGELNDIPMSKMSKTSRSQCTAPGEGMGKSRSFNMYKVEVEDRHHGGLISITAA
jgi:hypothetical protein